MGSKPAEDRTPTPKEELTHLKSELEATTERLRQEHQQHLQLETRLLNLMQSLEALLARVEGKAGWRGPIRTLLISLGGGIVGGGLVLAMAPWFNAKGPMAELPGDSQVGESQVEAAQGPNTVQFRCDEPCWLDIREANSGKRVFYKLLKGTANFAVGSGLDVFSGRADLVKVRINNGAEEPLLSGRVVGSRVIRPSKAAEPSP
jgi:hypothetical protein